MVSAQKMRKYKSLSIKNFPDSRESKFVFFYIHNFAQRKFQDASIDLWFVKFGSQELEKVTFHKKDHVIIFLI